MKNTLKNIGITAAVMCLVAGQKGKAQDIHFSQFYETSILRNPALTGIYNGDYRFGLMYRNQWNSVNSAPFQTATASAEIKKQLGESQDFLGFGVLGFFDRTGSLSLTTLSGNFAVSYNKNINQEHGTFLSFGLMGGYLQRNYDPSKMIFGNQYSTATGYDPSLPTGETNLPNPKTNQMDIGAGFNFTSNTGADNKTNYSIGLSAYHLTRPETGFYGNLAGVKQGMRFNLNVSSNWLIDDVWSAQALGNVQLQGNYREFIVGGMAGRKNQSATEDVLIFYGGLMFRVGDALIPVVKIDFNDLTFGMSYDMNVSKLRAASNMRGGFELSLIKTGLMSDPQRGFSSTVCPRR